MAYWAQSDMTNHGLNAAHARYRRASRHLQFQPCLWEVGLELCKLSNVSNVHKYQWFYMCNSWLSHVWTRLIEAVEVFSNPNISRTRWIRLWRGLVLHGSFALLGLIVMGDDDENSALANYWSLVKKKKITSTSSESWQLAGQHFKNLQVQLNYYGHLN